MLESSLSVASEQHKVWVSIGSNVDRTSSIHAAIRDLTEYFGELKLSPVYETPAQGFVGDNFYNLVAGFATGLSYPALHARLRSIEEANGRVRTAQKFSPRTLDIDILTYAEMVGVFSGKPIPNKEILQYAYVLKPLADVAPETLHPALGISYRVLWEQFKGDKDQLKPIILQ